MPEVQAVPIAKLKASRVPIVSLLTARLSAALFSLTFLRAGYFAAPQKFDLEFPLTGNLIFEFLGKRVDRRELVQPLVGPACVDQHAVRRVTARRALLGRQGRLAHRRPDAFCGGPP